MIDLKDPKQLNDIKNGIVIFTDSGLCSERLIEGLDSTSGVFNADVNTSAGKSLKAAFAIDYVPSAVFIKNGKFSMPVRGVYAILRAQND